MVMIWSDHFLATRGPSPVMPQALEAGSVTAEQFLKFDLGPTGMAEEFPKSALKRLLINPAALTFEIEYESKRGGTAAFKMKDCQKPMFGGFIYEANRNLGADEFEIRSRGTVIKSLLQPATIPAMVIPLAAVIFALGQILRGKLPLKGNGPGEPELKGVVRLLAQLANALGPIGMSMVALMVCVVTFYYFRGVVRNAPPIMEYKRRS